jgi:uncharacterized damage-inducible protein DinB
MTELERALAGDSAAAPPSHILEGLDAVLVHRQIEGVPHTIYAELWHVAFWQKISVDWIGGIETPYPAHASEGFPAADIVAAESWEHLCERVFRVLQSAVAAAAAKEKLETLVRCTSRLGTPVRMMTVREQLVSLAAHNHYHFGRIVLMRQILRAWPPPSGGDSW